MKTKVFNATLCAVLAFIFLISTGLTFASWRVQYDTINKITMGSVTGQIIEEYEQGQTVYPAGKVSKIVQVKNTGMVDSAIRVKIEKVWGDTRDGNGKIVINPDLSTDNIEITYNLENWLFNKDDGYFYYIGVLKHGATTPSLFNSFVVNGQNTGGAYKGKEADIVVIMEMVQATEHGLSYWNMSFEKLNITYTETKHTPIVTKVDFIDSNIGFVFYANEGDLFVNFKNLLHGETRSQEIIITNRWSEETEMFLWADFIEQTHATDETLKLIDKLLREYATIVITDQKGNTLYSGPVWGNADVASDGADSMKYPYSLGVFFPGQTKNLNVSLTLDNRMDNEYRYLLGLIKWVFSAEGTNLSIVAPPKTGDNSNVYLFASIMLISSVAMTTLLIVGKKKRKNLDKMCMFRH